jgi:glycosyltransferase involved in cell wall biosynthesis
MSDTRGPRVVLGMTLYNNARHLPEAAASILGQTYRDFALVMLDDASSDDTATVARSLASDGGEGGEGGVGPSVHVLRHTERQGMVPTWREVFERATAMYPAAEYFAWVSDHDVWAPTWLETLVGRLDVHQKTVMMYPAVSRIDDAGQVVDKTPRSFDTAGLNSVADRWERFCWEGFGSGDMVYGLMRVAALRRYLS